MTVAIADDIILRPNGWYTIDGQYYLKADDASIKGNELILTPDSNGAVSYEIFW